MATLCEESLYFDFLSLKNPFDKFSGYLQRYQSGNEVVAGDNHPRNSMNGFALSLEPFTNSICQLGPTVYPKV